jgi:hypothetical protein
MLDRDADAKNWEACASRISTIFSYAIFLGGIITVGVAVYMVVVSYSSLPYEDGWAQIDVVANGIDLHSLNWFWHQHNEHRFVIPKLFLVVDLLVFHANQVFLLASILLVQILHLALLGWSMRVLGGWRGDVWRTGVGVAAFCLFCASQWFNFVLGFQINFVLLGLFVTLSFVGLLLYWYHPERQISRSHAWPYLLLSILGALGATFSLANGTLLWPLLVAAAVFLRLRLSAIASLAIVGTISTALYFHHYVSPTAQPNVVSLTVAPAEFLKFVAVYFGSAWVQASLRAAGIIGIAGAGITCFLVLRCGSYVRTHKAFSLQMVLTLLFCIGTSFLTALGRLNFGVSYAFSPRYQAFILLFWCCLGLMILELASALKPKRVPFLVVQVCLLAVVLRGAYLAQYPIREARSHGFQLNVASMALLTGVPDWQQLSYVGVKLNYLMREAPYLQQDRLSVYSGDMYSQLGKPMDSLFRLVSPDQCTGALESTTPIEGAGSRALRITGWAWDFRHGRPPSEMIAATEGVVTGLAALGDWRPTVRAANPWMKSSYVGYIGYARVGERDIPVKIYAILGGTPRSACYIATIGLPAR